MTVGIYGIFDSETQECLYVGSSSNIEEREKQHLKLLKSGRHPRVDFSQWFRDNGSSPKLIEFRRLEECIDDDFSKNSLEIIWFKSLSPKYYGKEPSMNDTWKHSKETIEKIRKGSTSEITNPHRVHGIICNNCENKFFPKRAVFRSFCSTSCRYIYDTKKLDAEEIKKEYDSGMSLKRLGEKYNCSYRTIHNFMIKNNIPRRNFSEAVKNYNTNEK